MYFCLAAVLFVLSGAVVQITADNPQVSRNDEEILREIRDVFKEKLGDEKAQRRSQYAVFLYDDYDDIKKIHFDRCKRYTGGQVFLTRETSLKHPLKRDNCPFVAAKLPKDIEAHTEAMIFSAAKDFCPKKSRAYLYSYFSPCVACDNAIKNYVYGCADKAPFDLIIGYSKEYRDVKESKKEINKMKKHVAMTNIGL